MNVLTVIVACHTNLWIRVAIRSLREACGMQNVLCIDNNPDTVSAPVDEERAWLSRQPGVFVVKNRKPDKRHGTGLDLAAEVCKSLQADYMLLIEPDCLFTGREWYDGLLAAASRNVLMAGVDKRDYGPIHPCLSIWRIGEPWPTFLAAPYGDDVNHPRFTQLFNRDLILRRNLGTPWGEYVKTSYDTAQKAWFYAVTRDSAEHVDIQQGWRHFWHGSYGTAKDLPVLAREIARLAEFD